MLKYNPVSQTYTVGDEIPTSGDSYHYPDSFDCIVLRDGVAVRIRDKKITRSCRQVSISMTAYRSSTDVVLRCWYTPPRK